MTSGLGVVRAIAASAVVVTVGCSTSPAQYCDSTDPPDSGLEIVTKSGKIDRVEVSAPCLTGSLSCLEPSGSFARGCHRIDVGAQHPGTCDVTAYSGVFEVGRIRATFADIPLCDGRHLSSPIPPVVLPVD
ncbi:MAG: hypothetical protein IPJ34_07985 [Myxococcales bacterium]|nr:hypothetical protein [Myxococcales bacterium]